MLRKLAANKFVAVHRNQSTLGCLIQRSVYEEMRNSCQF